MTIESMEDVEKLQRIGQIVATIRNAMLDAIEIGMTTAELDAIGNKMLHDSGARSAPQLMYNFPGATCISVNEEVAHGIPSDRKIQAGDLVNIDVSAELDGYFADTGATRVVPPTNHIKQRVCEATQKALYAAIKEAKAGRPLSVIGKAVQRVARFHKLKVIKNLCSHGIGRALHEYPTEIPTFYDPHETRILEEGMVITIEPFLSTQDSLVEQAEDGWTLYCGRGNLCAQYEHTLIVTRNEPIILTQPPFSA